MTVPKESPQALEAWTAYCNMGADRSLVAVGQKLGKSKALMERWSKRHDWVVRSITHDQAIADEDARRDQVERLADLAKRRSERLAIASAMRLKAAGALQKLTIDQLVARPDAMIRMFQAANHAELLETGLATERSEITGPDGSPLLNNVVIYLPQKEEIPVPKQRGK
jgi:hypothetical protein